MPSLHPVLQRLIIRFEMGGPSGMGGKSWVNTRARIQRFSDGRFFAGPVIRDVPGGLTVSLPDGALEIGEECSVQLFGWTTSLLYATCVMAEMGTANFRIDKVVHENRPSTTEPRLVNRDYTGTMRTDEDLLSIQVLDASPTGMGALCDQPIAKDANVAINVRVGDRVVRFTGKVMNCGKASAHTFRVGIRLGSASVEDRDFWLEQFSAIN